MQNAVREALWTWNHWAGREVLVEGLFADDVRVTMFPCDGSTLAMAPHLDDHGRLSAGVLVCPSIIVRDDEYKTQTMVHEFGHILGFAHDPDNPDSIMYPYMRRDRKPHLTDADMRALNRVYGNRVH